MCCKLGDLLVDPEAGKLSSTRIFYNPTKSDSEPVFFCRHSNLVVVLKMWSIFLKTAVILVTFNMQTSKILCSPVGLTNQYEEK